MVRLSIIALRIGAALFGAAALAVYTTPVHAELPSAAPHAHVEGIVAEATENSVRIRPAIGDDVTLTVNDGTQIHVETKHGDHTTSAKSVDPTPPPPPTSFLHMYAAAQYDDSPSGPVATFLYVTPPFPLTAVGVVRKAGDAGFSLALQDGRELGLVVDANTVILLNGRSVKSVELTPGDRAGVLFFLTDAANLAVKVSATMAEPLKFGGVLSQPADGSQPASQQTFSVTDGGKTLTFKFNSDTAVRLDGKTVPVTALATGEHVYVLYRTAGDSLLALRVSAYDAMPGSGKGAPSGGSGSPQTSPGPGTGGGDKEHGSGGGAGKPWKTDPGRHTGDGPKPGDDNHHGQTPNSGGGSSTGGTSTTGDGGTATPPKKHEDGDTEKKPEYRKAGGESKTPEYRKAGGEHKSPSDTAGSDTNKSTKKPEYRKAGGEDKAPNYRKAGGTSQEPKYRKAGGTTKKPAGGSSGEPAGDSTGGSTGGSPGMPTDGRGGSTGESAP